MNFRCEVRDLLLPNNSESTKVVTTDFEDDGNLKRKTELYKRNKNRL